MHRPRVAPLAATSRVVTLAMLAACLSLLPAAGSVAAPITPPAAPATGHITEYPVTSLAAAGHALTVEQVADAVVARAVEAWAGPEGADDREVMPRRPLARPVEGVTAAERAPVLRLRQAGVDPAAGVELSARKPPWLRTPMRLGERYRDTARTVGSLSLTTVCEEAGCPNISECWAEGTATFMVNGSRCTRACGWIQRRPRAAAPARARPCSCARATAPGRRRPRRSPGPVPAAGCRRSALAASQSRCTRTRCGSWPSAASTWPGSAPSS